MSNSIAAQAAIEEIEVLTGETVTQWEAARVLDWCHEWAHDVFEDMPESYTVRELLRVCDCQLDGGLAQPIHDARADSPTLDRATH